MTSAARPRPSDVLPGDVAAVVVLARGDEPVASWPLEVRGRVDLSVVDDLARIQLAARRMGCSMRLRDACGDLTALLAFLGLAQALLQVVGEAEGGEEGGVEEVVVADDPVA